MTDFYERTSKAFDVAVAINGVAQNIEHDVVKIVFKKRKNDRDSEAILTKDAYELSSTGIAKFTLTAEETDIPCGIYLYEVKWMNNDNIYILMSSTVRVLERVFD